VIGLGTGVGTGGGTVVGIGVDAVDVDRLRTVMARRSGMADRLFTDGSGATPSGPPTRSPGWPPGSPPRRRP